jgi:hypothetical protein
MQSFTLAKRDRPTQVNFGQQMLWTEKLKKKKKTYRGFEIKKIFEKWYGVHCHWHI